MADRTETPITFKRFKGAIDENFVDPNDVSIEFVAKTTNLTPFRKIGSLVQSPGLALETSRSSLPTPAGFNYSDSHIFSVDRDNKEIRIVTFENGTDTKMYIKPYWNPATSFSNNNPAKTAESWINEWLELTENYSATIFSKSGSTIIVPTTPFTQPDNYFNGWFIVNTDLLNDDPTKFNLVTKYVLSSNEFTLKVQQTTWSTTNNVKLFRFPICYTYKAETPNNVNVDYSGIGTGFNAKPTQFLAKENQLRMPCGKNKKPIVLDMIYKRNYLNGENTISYDGFWLDFQQPQQVLLDSQVSSFGVYGSSGTEAYLYLNGSNNFSWSLTDPGAPSIKMTFLGLGSIIFHITVVSSGSTTETFQFSQVGDVYEFKIRAGYGTWTDFKNYINSKMPNVFILDQDGGGNFALVGTHNAEYNFASSSVGGGQEAGGNKIAKNLFLGSYLNLPTAPDLVNRGKVPFIMTALLDNRNEVILGHGAVWSNTVTPASDNMQLRFNCWFSRKITHINIYNYESFTATSDSILSKISTYPYFAWDIDKKVNEMPLFRTYPMDELTKPTNGETKLDVLVNLTLGYNCFKLDASSGYWFTSFSKDVTGYETKGKGTKFIVNTNRYIDQDITLNYTRACFIPQTNGRFFIIGVKNTITKPIYENDDSVHYNTYAVGVSCYDIYTLDKYVNIAIGNKDFNIDIFNFKGYILIFKQQNYYLLDVRTPNEVDYRVVDTFTGRGAIDYNSLCQTGYGVIVPAKDTVYLATHEGIKPILTPFNGRLQFYRDTFLNGNLQTIYYSEYNEIMIFKTSQEDSLVHPSYCLVYNFQYDQWTDYEFGKETTKDVRIVKAMTDTNKNVILVNYKDINNFNFVKLTESSYEFINVEETSETIIFDFETHSVSLSTHLLDLNFEWISLILGLSSNGIKRLNLTDTRKMATDLTTLVTNYSLNTPDTSSIKNVDNVFDVQTVSSVFQNSKLRLTNKISSTKYQYKYFSIDQIILWLFSQQRQKYNNILP
jgi:hypothetical protein